MRLWQSELADSSKASSLCFHGLCFLAEMIQCLNCEMCFAQNKNYRFCPHISYIEITLRKVCFVATMDSRNDNNNNQ